MTRQDILNSIKIKQEQRKALDKEILELVQQNLLFSDDKQWFTEELQEVKRKEGRKTIKENKLIGRVHWIEMLKDESTGKSFDLERSQVVRIDGEWKNILI